ncbi:SH3 domain-containing protein [candidate division KSB1 bacterium]|nr:SH3 domain-containing protein [candidate division KSB1 bacterium]
MRQLFKNETIIVIWIAILIFSLVISPLIFDISLAQSGNVNAPIISHQPPKIGYKGRSLSITANINDDIAIKNVSLVINYGGNSRTGTIPEVKAGVKVPVMAQVISNTKVYAGPNTKYRVKGNVYKGEILNVTRVKGNYIRIMTDSGLYGYIKANSARMTKAGKFYGVSIPASMTNESFITYQIVATDIYGGISKTKVNKVRLFTKAELAALRTQMLNRTGTTTAAGPSPSMTKYFVLAGLVAVSGGTYYFITRDKGKDDEATVNVVVEWE